MSGFAVLGTLIHAPVCGELEIKLKALVEVDSSGQISAIHDSDSSAYDVCRKEALDSGSLIELTNTQYLLPGMVDLHIHAPQWPQSGGALHLPLYDWLQQCTFPLEAKYADTEFAQKVYSSLVETLIANGTTTALYFATVHLESSKLLADICHKKG
jgi:guanine deaminase